MVARRQVLQNKGIFVDLAANVGICAIWAAELGAEMIALEPAADAFGLPSCPSATAAGSTAPMRWSAWAEVWQELAGWRRIWTSNGVWDTAIFFKPLD